jgi:ABC-type antimicrobial peptide transport system permease subunit
MMIKFALKNLIAKRRSSLVSFVGISISIALMVSTALILKNAQKSFAGPLENSGADMIVQLQGEPCVWSIVKLPSNINPIPIEAVDKIKALDNVRSVEGVLVTWAFSNPPISQVVPGQSSNPDIHPQKILQDISSGKLPGEPCDYAPPGSFCEDTEVGEIMNNQADLRPIVVAGVSPELMDIGPIKESDLETLQGRFFIKDDNYVAILDKDFARMRNLKIGEKTDIGQCNFTIIGIIDSGYDAKIAGAEVFVPIKTAIEMTRRGDIVDMIFIKLKSAAGIGTVKEDIKKILYDENVTITTSDDYVSIIAGVSKFLQQLMLVMFLIVILISFLFIVKIMFGSVLEQSKEIGILKAIGWQDRGVISLMIIENSVIGFLGWLAGTIFGFFISYLYKANLTSFLPYYLNPYPPCSQYLAKSSIQSSSIPMLDILSIFVFAILIVMLTGIAMGFIASKKVLKLTPVDAMNRL